MHRTTWAVLAVLLLAGCTTSDLGDARQVGEATLAAGGQTHLLLHLNTTDANATIALEDADGLDVSLPDDLHGGEAGMAGWVGVRVPDDAGAGAHQVVLRVGDEAVSFLIHVAEPEDVLASGDVAVTNLTLRTPEGALALTTEAAVDAAPLEHTEGYQSSPEPLDLPLDPQAGLPEAMMAALEGTGIGHSGTVELPEFYGALVVEHEQPRTESIERVQERQAVFEAPREAAEQQGLIEAGAEEGDIIELGGLPYEVEQINETIVQARLAVSEGERYTVYDAWPDASQVESVGEDVVRLRTDPPEGTFTWRTEWPNATEVAAMNETTIELRHSPEEGLQYTQMGQQGPVELTVKAVREDAIVLEQENPHPLAGQTMVLDFTIEERQDAPSQPGAPPS